MARISTRRRASVAFAAALSLPLLLAVAVRAAGRGAADGTSLLWPVDATPAIVSTFGEYRYDHLHAGVDISTGGVSGRVVRAAAAGSIYRLKVEWRGYGRALYLRHGDGRATVYGHLKAFDEAGLGLESRVARRRAEAGTPYPGDIYLEPPITVRRGQTIGVSGESGVGLPHLHFEVRGPADDPIDPFRAGLAPPPDDVPPTLDSIVLYAASPDSFIAGSWRERTIPLKRPRGSGDGPLRVDVSGPFTATLMAWDPAGGGRAGLRQVRALIDGVPCYSVETPGFRFDQYPIAGLIYDHRHSHLGPTTMAWRLGQLPGNTFARQGCAAGGPPGAFDLEPGSHRLEIVGTDAAGRERRATLGVVVAPRPGAAARAPGTEGPAARPQGNGAGRRAEGRYHTGFAEFVVGGAEAAAPPALDACAVPGIGSWTAIEGGSMAGVAVDYDRAAALAAHAAAGGLAPDCPLGAALAGTAIGVARPDQPLRLSLPEVSVEIPAGGRFFAGPVVLTRRPAEAIPTGLRAVGGAVDLLPAGEALDARATLAVSFDADIETPGRLGIYRYDPVTRRWTHEGDDVDTAGRALRCHFRRYGRLALLADESPPRITSVRPAAGGVVGRQAEIVAHVTEVGKGLAWDGVTFELDGERLPAEYDPDRGVARPFEAPRLGPGPHRLSVGATDRAGNRAEPVVAEFTVR